MSPDSIYCAALSSGRRHLHPGHILLSAANALLLLSLSPGLAAAASDEMTTADAEEGAIEEIVVTGSRIRRRDFTTSSPLTTINSEAISFSGQATLEEALNQMPQVSPSGTRTSNNPGDGSANVDLRGLGPGRSLVLLNGRRVAPSGIDNIVDLNNIPQILIDRVEIITGGTSTVYGSDAIAGVVNFITRDDFTGLGIDVGMSMAEQGDAETYDLDLAYGHNFANGHGNITVYGEMLDRKSLFAAERSFTRIPYFDDWDGHLIAGGSSAIPAGHVIFPTADLGNGPAQVTFNPDGTPREYINPDDKYNYQPVNYLQVPLQRLTLGAMGHHDLTGRLEGYLEAAFVRNEPAQDLAPVPAFVTAEINLDNPLLQPETRQVFADNYTCAPNLACIFLARRLLEMGPRLIERQNDYSRFVAGIRGRIWQDWSVDGWLSYTKEASTTYARNDASRTRLQQGLLVDPATDQCVDPSGGCVPLDIFGEGRLTADGVAFIRFADFKNQTDRSQALASVFITGPLLDTGAGPMDISIGAEWRRDQIEFRADDKLFLGDALGFNGQDLAPVDGTDRVAELYAEAVIPLASNLAWAEYLGLEVGGRYSKHKFAGGVWTYKAGAEWQPHNSLRLRTMYQRSARAPNSSELFQEQSNSNAWLLGNDPCSGSADPVGNNVTEKCLVQGLPADQIGLFEATDRYPVTYFSGGNPHLVPEIGKTLTVGAILSPESLSSWTLTIDYFSLEVTDTIGRIDSMEICFAPENTNHLFCDNIARDTSGNVFAIEDFTSNRGLLKTTGIDTQLQYQADLPAFLAFGDEFAAISLHLYWTHLLTSKEQENAVTDIIDCAGHYGWPCTANAYPANRVTTQLQYTSGPLALHLAWRWIEGTHNAAPFRSAIFGIPNPNLAVASVANQQYVDLGVAYRFGEHFAVRFGATNLLDNKPPQMADAVISNNTDTGLYDVFGRSYYLTLSTQF